MPEKQFKQEITKREIVIVDKQDYDDAGNLLFTDKNGVEFKLGVKRVKQYSNQIVEGRAVELGFASFTNKDGYNIEYIATAKLVSDSLPPATTPQTMHPEAQGQSRPVKEVIAGQAIGMSVKEIGDMIRAKMLKVVFGEELAPKVDAWYKSQMFHNMGIVVDSSLVKAAKKPGGVVIPPDVTVEESPQEEK